MEKCLKGEGGGLGENKDYVAPNLTKQGFFFKRGMGGA